MKYAEFKTDNGYLYKNDELGKLRIESEERLNNTEILDGILMEARKQGNVNKTIELSGGDYDGVRVDVKYTPISSWQTDDYKQQNTLLERVKGFLKELKSLFTSN